VLSKLWRNIIVVQESKSKTNLNSFNALVDHVIDICGYFFKKYTIYRLPPQLLEYRMFMLLVHVIWWECFLIFSPDVVAIDLVTLLNSTNFGVYSSVLSPCGKVGDGYMEFENNHLRRSKVYVNSPTWHD